jgi:hypothetical protein
VPGDGRCSRMAQGSTGAGGRFAAVISFDERPAKPRRTARTDSFGTRTDRGPGGAVEAVTMRRCPRAHRFWDKHSNVTAWPGWRQDVLWRFEALAGRVRYPGSTETLAAGLRRLRLRRSRMHPLGGSGISPNLFVDSDFTRSACPADRLAHRAARR